MPALESQIDEIYKTPAGEFTAARNALAKTLAGADAARVRKLPKPTLVPWTINQVYWHARDAFDRLRASGERLRTAQLAALKGRSADLRGAADAHRKAIADAVHKAVRLAEPAGARPNRDELTRALEALSLAPELPETPGRFTRPLQPAGFEALAGVPVKGIPAPSKPQAPREPREARELTERREPREPRPDPKEAAALERAEAELKKAQATRDRAAAAEARAHQAWEQAKRGTEEAERALARARERVKPPRPRT